MQLRKLSLIKLTILSLFMTISVTSAYADESTQQVNTSTITGLYSDVDMKLRLAVKENAAACEADQCAEYQAFDERVQILGLRLISKAYELYPELNEKISGLEINIAEKSAAATASNAKGQILVFRGIQDLNLSDEALAFVIGREMGHVIGQHHQKNTSTKLIITALASVVFPAVAIVSASSTAAQASTATTAITSAASTVTSYVGGEVAMRKFKPTQLQESDSIALTLMQAENFDAQEALSGLPETTQQSTTWLKDLQLSKFNLAKRLQQEASIAQFGY